MSSQELLLDDEYVSASSTPETYLEARRSGTAWEIDNDGAAEWALGKLREKEAREETIRLQAERMKKSAKEDLESLRKTVLPALKNYVAAQVGAKKSGRFRDFFLGRVALVRQREQIVVTDKAAAEKKAKELIQRFPGEFGECFRTETRIQVVFDPELFLARVAKKWPDMVKPVVDKETGETTLHPKLLECGVSYIPEQDRVQISNKKVKEIEDLPEGDELRERMEKLEVRPE